MDLQNSTDRNFPAVAGKYARGVVRGKILACQWVKLACQRHLDDLKRWPKVTSEYHFDKAAATKVCKFIELLPHIKGKWARRKEKIVLEPWQIFFLCVVFGWKKPDGNRRFNTAYLEVARKNAKSTLASGIALYMLTADGEEGAEVYSAATSRDQAKIVFGVSRAMARKSCDLRDHYGLDVNAHNLNVIGTESKYEALSSEGNSLDGLNIHCSVVDELHAHKTREVFDVLEGTVAAYGAKYLQEMGDWREIGQVLANKPVKALGAACDKELALGNIEKGVEYCDRALELHEHNKPQPLAARVSEYRQSLEAESEMVSE